LHQGQLPGFPQFEIDTAIRTLCRFGDGKPPIPNISPTSISNSRQDKDLTGSEAVDFAVSSSSTLRFIRPMAETPAPRTSATTACLRLARPGTQIRSVAKEQDEEKMLDWCMFCISS
jgi:hypothetical protein